LAAAKINSVDTSNQKAQKVKRQLVELFTGKFDMEVDVIEPSPQTLMFLYESFQDHSVVILSHQSIPLAHMTLMERFRIAMMFRRRTPSDFLSTIGLPISHELAQLSNTIGETALHWAAREWFDQRLLNTADQAETRAARDCTGLVVELLKYQPLVHALDKYGRSPLMSFLDFSRFEEDTWVHSLWCVHDRAAASNSWAELLAKAGVSLPEYVARENDFLTALSRTGDHIGWSYPQSDPELKLKRFVLSEQQTIHLEVTHLANLRIWEFRPPPGIYDSHEHRLQSFCPPNTEDGTYTFWQNTITREIESLQPFRWTRSHDSGNLEPEDSANSIFHRLFTTTLDDHSSLALLLYRDRHTRNREQSGRRRRSSSMPPLGKLSGFRYGFNALHPYDFILPSERRVLPLLHKCLFDSQWGFDVPGHYGEHSWSACMKGCHGRTDYSSLFDEFLEHTALRPKRTASELERLGRIVEMD
jgi:hypothetical protein